MAKHFLNSAVIPHEGVFSYENVTPTEAANWYKMALKQGHVESYCAYKETLYALEVIWKASVQEPPPIPRLDEEKRRVVFASGDEALVFRLTKRIPSNMKNSVKLSFILKNCEFGIQKCISITPQKGGAKP